jgi:transposase InsO family protein
LRRIGLGRLTALEPKPPAVRYQRERPGELIHIDVKKVGRIEAVGHRITGDPRDRRRGAGWEYLHVCIDDASRLAYSEVLRDERKESAVPFLERALAWFAGYGVTVERVITDNGSAYRSHYWRQACGTLRLSHLRTKPYTPRTNGKAERFIQTSLREWAYAQAYTSSQARQDALADWLDRPHSALANRPPATRLGQNPFLGLTAGTVPSSRPGSSEDRSGGPRQGAPKATGDSRRAASLRRSGAAVTLTPGGIHA